MNVERPPRHHHFLPTGDSSEEESQILRRKASQRGSHKSTGYHKVLFDRFWCLFDYVVDFRCCLHKTHFLPPFLWVRSLDMVWLGPQRGVSQGCEPAVSQDPEFSSLRLHFLRVCQLESTLSSQRPPSGPCHRGPSYQGNHHLAACPFKAGKGVRDAVRQVFQSCNVIMPSQPCSHIQHVMFCCWKQVTGPTLKGWITPGHEHQEVGIMYATLGVCPPQPQTRKFAQTLSTISSCGN